MLYAVLVHHILAKGVQNNRQAPYRTPAYFLSSSPLNLVHSLSAEGLIDLLRRNELVGEGVEDPLLVRQDLHDPFVDGGVAAGAGAEGASRTEEQHEAALV